MLPKARINSHLKTHLKKETAAIRPGKSYLLKVEAYSRNSPVYFLSLWVDGRLKMDAIDVFLRDIWLDSSCGHRGTFTYSQTKQQRGVDNFLRMMRSTPHDGLPRLCEKWLTQSEKDMESNLIPMQWKVKSVFRRGVKLKYEYGIDPTTTLQLTLLEEYGMSAFGLITLLSRNEPLEWLCHSCKKLPATQICTAELDSDSMFCDECAKKHAETCPDFEDSVLPVVNSPRMGMCDYTGGWIDTERDGPASFE
jgi:hypothetical protein